MEKVGCGQTTPILRNGKKKQAKYELDRQKQAEKKKRRLEKALATSAAIRSELEKKKQKKLEEQQGMIKEGAAIAAAVTLHVLIPREGNKKQAKVELDHQKQAEKKKRRLEKALATSAALRSELEKKKQKKLEEQQRLDKEGAAIAEAVALHVLGEDTDESCQIMLNPNEEYNPWDYPNNHGFVMGHPSFRSYTSVGGLGWVTDAYGSGCKWNDRGFACSFPWGMHVGDLQTPYYEKANPGAEISPGLIAAQAVSSLRLADTRTRIHSLDREGRLW